MSKSHKIDSRDERQRIDPRDGRRTRRETRKQLASIPAKPSRVLLVEDDRDMREMLALELRKVGHEVIEAADGNEALTWLGPGVLEGDLDRVPSVIVSDVRLPYFSGLEVLEGMQLTDISIPVILITAFGDSETHAAARLLGAERVLDKPFDTRALLAAVSSALYDGRRELRTEDPEGAGGG